MDNQTLRENLNGNEIAIIGLAGCFPGARDIPAFWQNLLDGTCSISFFTNEELLEAGVPPETLNDPSYVKAGSIIEGADLFDANFFGYSPREAEIIDPQQRLFLEKAWMALEDAGYTPETFAGSIGVYAGVTRNTYLLNNLYNNPDVIKEIDGFQLLIASDKDHLATRTSYKLNLRGPSLTVQTACSTSLVAIHLGCQSLLNGECDLALAGGVSIKVPQKRGYFYQKGGIFSSDGFCRAFDAQSQGTIDTSGLGIVVLKRLSDAIDSRDHIYAVIKGSAINNDGALKMGYTAPSVQGQAAVISEALFLSGIAPEDISYVEAHGTGTPLGDPIEIAALQQVFTAKTSKNSFCAIGSVKTNIGHVDVAAGVAGLIKTVLALKNGYLPASLHFSSPNPSIDFATSPFYVNTSLKEWPKNDSPRRAGVSSFGIGGTNSHVVLEETPELPLPEEEKRDFHLLVLSARTPTALDTASKQLAAYLERKDTLSLPDVTYTLQVGRKAFEHRQILICENLQDAVMSLQSVDPARLFRSRGEPGKHSLVFMFSGQGTQYVGMGRELYEQEEVFRAEVDRCCEIIQPLLGLDLRSVLYPQVLPEDAARQLDQTWLAQPALFVIEYALAKLWMHWGIQPTALVGHSIGEYVAACLSGVFSLKDALTLVVTRGRLVQQLPTGSMLAISLPPEEFSLPEGLSLAVINGPSQCVVSGQSDLIAGFQHSLEAGGVECRLLHTSHAFHSAMLDAVLPLFAAEMQQVKLSRPQIPYLSNVYGTWITAEQAVDSNYWVQQLRQTVLFGPALNELKAKAEWILLEVGPGRTLSTVARQSLPDYLILSSLPSSRDHSSAVAFILTTLGRLWLVGCSIIWANLYSQQRQRLSLPTYPFERERFWIEPPKSSADPSSLIRQGKIEAKAEVKDWFYLPAWIQSISPRPSASKSVKTTNWLIFSDSLGFTRQLSSLLTEQGDAIISVQRGETFAQIGEYTYNVNPQRPEDYQALLAALLVRDIFPTKVIHAWLLCLLDQQTIADRLADSMDCGYYSLLYLAQAIASQNTNTPLKIHLLTNNMQAIVGEEALCPEKAPVLGPCKTIPQEYSYMNCQSIDIAVPQEDSWQKQRIVEQIFYELLSDASDAVVAYRQNQRWVQSFERLKVTEKPELPVMLRQKGVYLLIGGLGNIGLLFAEYLSKTVQADLILLGRSPFPKQHSWAEWIATHKADDEMSRKIIRLQAIEHSGSRVLHIQADASDAIQMGSALAEAHSHFGELHGVIYAAGAARTALAAPLHLTDKEVSEQHFQPKMKGLLVLEAGLAGKNLDFCLFQSSLSSLLGGLGFTAYAAANLFIDAYTQAHNCLNSVPWLAVNWDSWQLGNDTTENNPFFNSAHITAEEGIEAFPHLLTGNTSQIVVSTYDLKKRLEQWINPRNTMQSREKKDLITVAHARPQLQTAFVSPRNETEQHVAEIWEDFLGTAQISVYDNFFELGGDSLLGTQLISQLYATFGVEIHIQDFSETPTVAAIAAIIQEKITATSAPIV